MSAIFEVSGTAWIWHAAPPAKGSWHFLTIDAQTAAEIRYEMLGQSRAFGSVKVIASIRETRWQTSLFPHKESGGFLLPLKADVRRREGIAEGATLVVRIEV